MLCQLIVEQVNSYLQIVISEVNSLPRFLCFYVDNGYYLNKRKISKRLSDRIVYNFRSRNRVSIRLYKEKIRTIRWLSANNSDYTSLVRLKRLELICLGHRILSPARMPIPPQPHKKSGLFCPPVGAPSGTRTLDLLIKSQPLYQLSQRCIFSGGPSAIRTRDTVIKSHVLYRLS